MLSQIVSVIFQKAASGVGIDPSSETDFVRVIDTVFYVFQRGKIADGGSGT